MRKSNFLALLDMTRCWFNHKLFLSTSPPPRCGTKQTTWFHQRRTELFLSQPTSLLLPTRLGGSVLRCELFMINITNIMDIIYITNAAINHTIQPFCDVQGCPSDFFQYHHKRNTFIKFFGLHRQ